MPGRSPALGGRPVPLGEVRREAPGEHLLHRRVVVVAGDVDLEPAVLALVRQAVLEHDHRPDVVGALEVGHVVALDAQRRLGQAEVVLQLGERPAAGVVVAGPAQAVAGELLLGVAGDGLEQRALVAALRHADLHPRAALQAQPLLVGRRRSSGSTGTSTCLGTPCGGSSPYRCSRMRSISPPGREVLDLVETKPLRPTTRPLRT